MFVIVPRFFRTKKKVRWQQVVFVKVRKCFGWAIYSPFGFGLIGNKGLVAGFFDDGEDLL
jgi:hypothetical protein